MGERHRETKECLNCGALIFRVSRTGGRTAKTDPERVWAQAKYCCYNCRYEYGRKLANAEVRAALMADGAGE